MSEPRLSNTPFDNGWDALFNPGKATVFFQDQAPPLDAADAAFNITHAWWCAELSRLIYRQEADELGAGATGPTRDAVLAQVGLCEATFIRGDQGTDAAIIVPRDAASARRFAVLVFRGTHDERDWLSNLNAIGAAWRTGGVAHLGFQRAFDAVWSRIAPVLDDLDAPMIYTGHSLGGALATLASAMRPPRAVYTFGSPRVGDATFAKALAHVPHYRVVNNRDMVPTLPTEFGPPGYRHHGTLLHLTRDSRVLHEADESAIAAEREANDSMWPITPRQWAQIFDLQPARFLADHAPVNYVAHLARNLPGRHAVDGA